MRRNAGPDVRPGAITRVRPGVRAYVRLRSCERCNVRSHEILCVRPCARTDVRFGVRPYVRLRSCEIHNVRSYVILCVRPDVRIGPYELRRIQFIYN